MKTRRFLISISLALTACFSLPAVADVAHAPLVGSFADVGSPHQISDLVVADAAVQVAIIGGGSSNVLEPAEAKVMTTNTAMAYSVSPGPGSGDYEADGLMRPNNDGIADFGSIYSGTANARFEVGWRS